MTCLKYAAGVICLALMTFAGAIWAADSVVDPYLAVCPIDKHLASYIGQQRILDGKQECQYQHIWIHLDSTGDTTLDEKHIFWAPCTVKE